MAEQIQNKLIEEEMKESYIDYSMSVIVGRALPDVHDGLKPVHRRILFAMNDLGLSNNKPTKKSARIVGECFTKDTLILTDKGLLPIDKIKPRMIVYTQNNKKKVKEIYEMPEQELLNLELENGITLNVTPSQKFKILNENLKYKWKEAKHLTENESLVLRAYYPEVKSYKYLGMIDNKKVYLNENMGYLIGQLLSDGWVEKRYSKNFNFRCGFCSSSNEIINKIKQILKDEFYYKSTIELKNKEISTSNGQILLKQMYYIRINSGLINNFLVSKFALKDARALTKKIPNQFLVSPKKVIYSFISGLIDGDGSIHNEYFNIHYGSISEDLINKLQILLQQLGILSRKYRDENPKSHNILGREIKKRHTFFNLEIQGRFALTLAKNLILFEKEKAKRISKIIEESSSIKTSKFDIIPNAGSLIFKELTETHIGSGWYIDTNGKKIRSGIRHKSGCKIRYSKDLREKNLGRIQIVDWGIQKKLGLIGSKYTDSINKIINNNIYFLKIKGIKIHPPEKTYDIEVEEDHEFVANGIISHNCLGKYHPHGDIAVYDALVRMAQDFSLRYPLVIGQGNFGCFTKDTKVKLADGRNLSFKDLIKEYKKGKVNYIYTITSEGSIKIGKIDHPRLTKKKAEILKVTLDNGEEIRCTFNHLFMLRDGSYKEAKYLNPGTSLMPFYSRLSEKKEDPNIAGYLMIYNPKNKDWIYAHHIADEWNITNKMYTKSNGRIRHHINFNKLDNNPSNIKRLNWRDHWKIHYELTSERHKNDVEYVRKLAEGRKKYWANSNSKKKLSERTSLQNLNNWKNAKYRKKMTENLKRINKEYYKNHPELKEVYSKRAKETLKKLWANKDYRKMKSDSLKIRWKNNDPTMNKFTSQTSKIIWSKPEHRKFISESSKKFWQNGDNKIRLSELNKDRWANNETYRNRIMQSLTKNGDITTFNRFLRVTNIIIKKYGDLNEQNYEQERKKEKFLIRYKKAIEKFFDNDESKLKKRIIGNNNLLNHKVVNVEFLNEREDVYDLTIENTHNFALSAGVFVHNSVDGDSSAHMRYTEVKLSKMGEELLEDIDKETVKFVPNFDNSTKEPVILPSKFPNLLLNGSSGIAVGMATNMPPHNLSEVVDAAIKLIENPNLSIEEIMQFIKGPDFPTGALILGRAGILNAYKTGRGQLKLRANVEIKEKKLIVTEIPYQVNKSLLIEGMADLVRDKRVEGISDIRDESDRKGMRIVIELKQNANPEVVLNQLYKHSQLQTTFGVINLALVAGQPKILDLKSLINSYVKHRKRIITRRTQFELTKAEDRAHILEGLKIALSNIDPVVKAIKSSDSVENARSSLIKTFKLTEKQAVAILEMRLQRLTSLETSKVRKEHEELVELIVELKSILANESKIYNIIKQELTELKQKYHDERRTKIIDALDEEIEDEDLIKEEQVVITMTHQGYIKRLPIDTYKQQRRGGRGIIATETKEEDFVEHLFITSTHNFVLFFTDKGNVFWLKGYKIPDASRYSKGSNIINLLSLEKEEKITSMIPIKEFRENEYLLMITKNGILKKTALIEYSNPRKTGIIAINLKDNDKLINVKLTDGSQKYIVATKNGLAVRFDEKDVRPVGRNATGVKGIRLIGNDEVIGIELATNDNDTLLTVTENGYGKRSLISDYRLIRRGGKGVINIKTSGRNGKVVAIKTVKDNHELISITKKGILIRTAVNEISVVGRNTQGVRLIKLDENDKLINVARIINNNHNNN